MSKAFCELSGSQFFSLRLFFIRSFPVRAFLVAPFVTIALPVSALIPDCRDPEDEQVRGGDPQRAGGPEARGGGAPEAAASLQGARRALRGLRRQGRLISGIAHTTPAPFIKDFFFFSRVFRTKKFFPDECFSGACLGVRLIKFKPSARNEATFFGRVRSKKKEPCFLCWWRFLT